MTDHERFYDMVERMRSAQKRYFKTRDANAFIDAKALEMTVDKELRRHKEPEDPEMQKNLF